MRSPHPSAGTSENPWVKRVFGPAAIPQDLPSTLPRKHSITWISIAQSCLVRAFEILIINVELSKIKYQPSLGDRFLSWKVVQICFNIDYHLETVFSTQYSSGPVTGAWLSTLWQAKNFDWMLSNPSAIKTYSQAHQYQIHSDVPASQHSYRCYDRRGAKPLKRASVVVFCHTSKGSSIKDARIF